MVKDGNIDTFDTLFETSHSWFDAIIHLNEFKCSRIKELKPKEIEKGFHRIQIPGWDLSKIFLNQLEKSYGHLAWFFSQENDSSLIGIKFKKMNVCIDTFLDLLKTLIFKDLNGLEGECFGGLAKGEDRLYSNRKGLLNDFRILGDGLIDSIIVQKDI